MNEPPKLFNEGKHKNDQVLLDQAKQFFAKHGNARLPYGGRGGGGKGPSFDRKYKIQ